MAPELKVGAVVQLKSGGPKMTIQDIGDYSHPGGTENSAKCFWFDGNEQKVEYFDISGLQIVEVHNG